MSGKACPSFNYAEIQVIIIQVYVVVIGVLSGKFKGEQRVCIQFTLQLDILGIDFDRQGSVG
jgi:hypothetical protein